MQTSNYLITRYNFKHECYHKVKCISKGAQVEKLPRHTTTMIYPKVHTLAGATLRWSDMDAKDMGA
jgi:hypothetical protein